MPNGILLIDKDEGVTSRKVDNLVSHTLGERKCGHLGTLDPFASGLLVLALGKATKLLPYLDDAHKSYFAVLKLGTKTATGDLLGETLKAAEVPDLDPQKIVEVLSSFLGKSYQVPPKFSALKINGVPSYKRAARGEEYELKQREIEVSSINLISYDKEEKTIAFTSTVSRGTYIRTLGEDIAEKLGTLGHLIKLRRLSVGPFLIAQAKKAEEVTMEDLLDPTLFIRGLKHIEIRKEERKAVIDGRPFYLPDYGEKIFLCLDGEALAVYHRVEDHYEAERGLW